MRKYTRLLFVCLFALSACASSEAEQRPAIAHQHEKHQHDQHKHKKHQHEKQPASQPTSQPTSQPATPALYPARHGEAPVVDKAAGTVSFSGYVQAVKFNDTGHMKGFHFLVPTAGENFHNALFVAFPSKMQFYEALKQLGAREGNNIPMAALKRKDPANSAADLKAEGSPLRYAISWEGSGKQYAVPEILRAQDPSGAPVEAVIDFRFTGNKERRPQVGCFTCLYSCPIGTSSNGALSQRDYGKLSVSFRARTDVLPKDGSIVTFTVQVMPDPAKGSAG